MVRNRKRYRMERDQLISRHAFAEHPSKVPYWRRKLLAIIVAGGAVLPGISYAVNIPLCDPSFDLYIFPAAVGYAYAQDPFGKYRHDVVNSPWVDDPDSPPGFAQDAGGSNWIYDSNYA